MNDFLQRELDTPVLNEIYSHFWLAAKKSGDHVDALHKQLIKRRNIIVAEDAALHLVWYHETLYVKPIPQCLINYAFWEEYLLPSKLTRPGVQQPLDVASTSHVCRTALGYLRSYSFLVRHESDFLIAQRADLIPKDIPYQGFRHFILPFRSLSDEVVSPRYHFGPLRLTRLKCAVRLLRPSSIGGTIVTYYEKRYWQTGDVINRFGAPLVFFFATFSVLLSAMQVVLAALGQNAWSAFIRASWGFSVAVMILIAGLAASFIIGILGILVAQGQFALRMRHQKKVARKQLLSAWTSRNGSFLKSRRGL